MGPEAKPSLQTIFNEAIEVTDPAARAEYLNRVCGTDSVLRRKIEDLIQADRESGNFLKESDARPSAEELAQTESEERGTLQHEVASGTPGGEKIGDRIGHYKLREKIGEGGCGVVYVAEQQEPVRRRVALKVIKVGMDTRQVVARFEAERQALAMMDHPNIAKVLDAGATNTGRPFFVMELVRGVRITDYCDQHKLTTAQRLDLFVQVCNAVQHAHQKGIIHRDLKPSNILVTLHDGVPVPKVIDFGIAKATEGRLTDLTVYTELHQFIGTPTYTSPEQAEMSGLDIDTRSDIYSLGVLLYELLTGATPFDPKELLQRGLEEMRRTIREVEPSRPSTRLSTLAHGDLATVAKARCSDPPHLIHLIRGDLDWIVMKCLEKDRARRYETANALALELRRYLAHEPVQARPPGTVYRFQKFVRRNKVAAVAATCVTLALIAGLAVSTWSFLRERTLRGRAVAAELEQSRLRQEAEDAQAAETEQRQLAEANARKAIANELHARRSLYAADMNLAQQALDLNNIGWASELLNQHRPPPGQPDLRGWEWRFLWQRCQSDALFTLGRRPASIYSLSVSRDGRLLAVGEFGTGGLSVWDVNARQQITQFPASKGCVLAAFSPREDLLAFTTEVENSARRRDTIHVWNSASKEIIAELPLGGLCRGLAFSGDGRTVIAAKPGPDSELILWDVLEPKKMKTHRVPAFLVGSAERSPFAVAPASNLAALATRLSELRVVDLATGEERWTARAAEEAVVALAFTPDAKILASGAGYWESAVRLWDVARGKETARLVGHRGYITHLLFWPDGKTLASASSDQTIRLWDISDPTAPQPRSVLRGHQLEVWQIALLPDNRTLVSGSKDGTILVWDTAVNHKAHAAVALPVPVKHWRFAADTKSVLTVEKGGWISHWTGKDFQENSRLIEIGPDSVGEAFSDTGRFLATGSVNGIVTVWDLQERRQVHRLKVGSGRVHPGAVSRDGRRVELAQFVNNTVEGWDLAGGINLWSTRMPVDLRFGVASPDSRWILVGGDSGDTLLRNMLTGEERRPDLRVLRVSGAAFSPDGNFFAVASYSGYAKLFEATTLNEAAVFRGLLQGVHSVAFSPDGRRFATGGSGVETLRLWDLESHQQLLTLEADGSAFNQTGFSSDGNLLASKSGLGVLHIWRAPSWEQIDSLANGGR